MSEVKELTDAISILVKFLKNDAAYRYTWQANIAMAFKDEFMRSEGDPEIHYIANNAAINFINNLIMDKENAESK